MNLPAELREKAARAAFDAEAEVIGFNEDRDLDRDFKVQIVAWRAVVDSVVEVLAEHQAETDEAGDDTPFPWELHLKAAHIALREVSKHAEAETARVEKAEAERDEWEKLARSCGTHAEKWMNTAKKMDRKLSRQRKRRKAAEVRELETRVELEFLSVHAGQVAAERDALQARVESLRAALEQGAGEDICEVYTPATGWTDCRDAKEREAWCPACVNRDALAADDRAAGRTEEVSDDHS